MSLSDFFTSIDLHIEFVDEFFHEKFINLFDHFKREYVTNADDVIEELKSSYRFETNETMNHEMYERMMNEENDIRKLYSIIEPKLNCKRNKSVYVNDAFGTAYVGAKQSYINIDKLQNWVDKYHSYEFENNVDGMLAGFILYLLYVRIHPHFDGNGRMSRYLFLENKLNKVNFCPLSKILDKCLMFPMKYMNEIYEYIDASIDPNSAREEDYYHLKLDVKVLKKIYYIIYISICYKYCLKHDAEMIKLIDEIDDCKSIFCLGKAVRNVGKSTTVKTSDGRRDRAVKYAKRINELLDFNTHKEIINELGIVY